jgi:hypothetical protein
MLPIWFAFAFARIRVRSSGLESCTIIKNTWSYANCEFSARYVDVIGSTVHLEVSDSRFYGITTTGLGGACRCQGLVTMTRTNFTDCGATVGGGMAICRSTGLGNFTDCWFTACKFPSGATGFGKTNGFGGALGLYDGASCTCTRTHFVGNAYGGISVEAEDVLGFLILSDCEFINNSGCFGGIYVTNSTLNYELEISRTKFAGNPGSETVAGKAIWLSSPVTFSINHSIFNDDDIAINLDSQCSGTFVQTRFFGSGLQIQSNSPIVIDVIDFIWFEEIENATENVTFTGGCFSCPLPSATPYVCPVEALCRSGDYTDRLFSGIEITSGTVRLIRCLFHTISLNHQGGAARCQCKVYANFTNFTRCGGSVGVELRFSRGRHRVRLEWELQFLEIAGLLKMIEGVVHQISQFRRILVVRLESWTEPSAHVLTVISFRIAMERFTTEAFVN